MVYSCQTKTTTRGMRGRKHLAQCHSEPSFIRGRPKSNQPELLNFQDHANAAFKSFCDAKGLSPKSVIARHLRAIFDAGINESRLEVTPLVKNTGSYLLRSSNLFRSVLSLFIIIGLLGTLGGLASTLGQLSQISPEGDQGISTAQPPPNDQSGTQPIGEWTICSGSRRKRP